MGLPSLSQTAARVIRNMAETSLDRLARHLNMEQVGMGAPGTQHKLDPGN